MLVAAGLRHIADTKGGYMRYINTELTYRKERRFEKGCLTMPEGRLFYIQKTNVRKILDTTNS